MADRPPEYRPGDAFLNRNMPEAEHEAREEARENLKAFVAVLLRIATRLATEEQEQRIRASGNAAVDSQEGALPP